MDRRLLAIPIVILFGAVLLSSGLMNALLPGQGGLPAAPAAPAPSGNESVVIMQKADSNPLKGVGLPGNITEPAPAPLATMGGMGSAPTPALTLSPASSSTVYTVKANFTAEVDCLNVTFTDLSENATSWTWDFGDGNVQSELPSPYTYEEAGTYLVNLTVSDASGQTDYKTRSVAVSNCSTVDEPEDIKTPNPVDSEIPEFPTIALPMLAIIGMAFFFNRKQ
jgi:hypothetical protein